MAQVSTGTGTASLLDELGQKGCWAYRDEVLGILREGPATLASQAEPTLAPGQAQGEAQEWAQEARRTALSRVRLWRRASLASARRPAMTSTTSD